MEADQLDSVGNLFRHGPEDLFETVERLVLLVEDVALVDLIGKKEDSLVVAELNDLLHVVQGQASTGRVSRVDDDQSFDGCFGFLGLGDRVFENRLVQ
jgi:hypothetical protein